MRPSYGFSSAGKQILSGQGFQVGTRTHHQDAVALSRRSAASLSHCHDPREEYGRPMLVAT